MKYDLVIFDKDGVLLDSSTESLEWMDRLRKRKAEKRGADITMEQSKQIFRAKTSAEIKKIANELGLELSELCEIEKAVAEEKMRRIDRGEIELFDSAEKVLEEIDVPKSIASNAPRKATEHTVKSFGLENHFDSIHSPELKQMEKFVERRKPSPWLINQAIESTGAKRPVMVGDSDNDVSAADEADIDSIHVKTRGKTNLQPDYCVDCLKEILEIIGQE